MSEPFAKVEGLGNDFVLFDGRTSAIEVTAERAVALCDRHLGIGADGVLVLTTAADADARLTIWNADGSRAEMCGNGLRCAARLLLAESGKPEVRVETAAGSHRCRPDEGDGVWVELVGLDVGEPETLEVPWTELNSRSERPPLSLTGRRVRLGNPHFVVFGGADPARAAQLGPALERHRAFAPDRTNVEFCEATGVAERPLRVRVWERGVGLTLACGTGAAAAAAAAWADGHLPRKPTWIELPGGAVRIDPVGDATLGLCGPTRLVYRGVLGH